METLYIIAGVIDIRLQGHFEDLWHSHLLPSISQLIVFYLFQITVETGIRTPNLQHARQTLYHYATAVIEIATVFGFDFADAGPTCILDCYIIHPNKQKLQELNSTITSTHRHYLSKINDSF